MPVGRKSFGKFGKKRRDSYLNFLREGKSRSAAADGTGVSRELVRLYRKRYKSFGRLEDAAEQAGIDAKADRAEDALDEAAQSGNVRAIETTLYNLRPNRWQKRQTFDVNINDDELNAAIEERLAHVAAARQAETSAPAPGNGRFNGDASGPANGPGSSPA